MLLESKKAVSSLYSQLGRVARSPKAPVETTKTATVETIDNDVAVGFLLMEG